MEIYEMSDEELSAAMVEELTFIAVEVQRIASQGQPSAYLDQIARDYIRTSVDTIIKGKHCQELLRRLEEAEPEEKSDMRRRLYKKITDLTERICGNPLGAS